MIQKYQQQCAAATDAYMYMKAESSTCRTVYLIER